MKFLVIVLLGTIIFTIVSCGNSTIKSPQITREAESQVDATKNSGTDFWKGYTISNADYGTKTSVILKDGKRVMTTNALPNHSTGTFPNSGNPNSISAQNITYSFPITPMMSGESKWAREPGVALNGVKFEPETAERFVCETGEVYRIEAFQDLVNLGLDHNHAHVQPTGAYHYHGAPVELIEQLDTGDDIIHVGFAKDGFPIYYSKSGKYNPSYQLASNPRTGDACAYNNPKQGMTKELNNTQPDGTFVSDWDYIEGLGELDECNGIMVDGQYMYFLTDDYPYVSRCLKGIFTEEHSNGPPPGEHTHNGRPPHGKPPHEQ